MAFGTDPVVGRPYLVMEFIDGPSLIDVLEKGPLSLDDAKYLVARLAAGLDAAHQLGVIHRDVSCDNVILAGGNVRNAKIIDFGIARSTKSVTLLDGKFAGKYNFVSPEQLGLFNSNISEATDVYSLGLVMVNMLRGTPIDMNGTQVEIIEKRRSVPDISDIDHTVRPVIELMLQPDPKDRNVTMSDIVDWFTPETTRSRSVKPVPTTPPRKTSDAVKPVQTGATASGEKAESPFAATVLAPAVQPEESQDAPSAKAGMGPESGAGAGEPASKSAASGYGQARKGKASEETVFSARSALPGDGLQPESQAPIKGDILPLSTPKTPVSVALERNAETAMPPARAPGKSKMPMVAAAVLALAAAGGGGWYFMNRQTASTTAITAPALQPNQTAQETGLVSTDPAKATQSAGGTDSGANGQSASLQTPAGTGAKPEIVDNATLGKWISDYKGGDCFFAHLTSTDPKAVAIEAVANQPKLIDDFKAAYKTKFGGEPKIEQKLIVDRQCAVAQFLASMAENTASPMTLTLKKSKLKSGDPLSGQVEGLSKPNALLYLIDNDGFVYQIDQFLKRSESKGSFRMKLVELESRKPLPQLVLILSSEKPVKGGALSQPAEAGNLMPKMIETIRKDNTKLDYGFAFFELGGT
jgi:serine/threonine-protein kinase